MSAISGCPNPLCTCTPCTCAECACNAGRLGELERRVMDVVWAEPGRELTGRAVSDLLPDHAYTTVATVLDRLVHKGLVRRRSSGRTIRYAATGTPAGHAAVLMRAAMNASGDPAAALESFARSMSEEESAALRRLLDR